jgi:dienelactone hydrolase
MRTFWLTSLASALLASSLCAQTNSVGYTDVSWVNASGVGSSVLAARVHYPAVLQGANAPVLPTTTGYPVVVFLHGYAQMGSDYSRMGGELATLGFVAIMLDTARYDYLLLEQDARAMFGAIAAATAESGGFFEGAMDTARVGLLGHSMGGAVIAYVVNEDPGNPAGNPGYRCALGFAPVDPALAVSNTIVRVPIGLVSGQGDVLTPPAQHAAPYYASLVPAEGLKFHYQMGAACGHMNIVGLTQDSNGVFQRTKKIMKGFFGQFLSGSVVGLEAVLGVDGVTDPNLVAVEMDSVVPQSWASGSLKVGGQTRVSIAAEPGFAGLLAANSTSLPTSTMIGTLLLDPASTFSVAQGFIVGERFDVMLSVPQLPQLLGTSFAVQGAGATINEPCRLGSAITFVIGG